MSEAVAEGLDSGLLQDKTEHMLQLQKQCNVQRRHYPRMSKVVTSQMSVVTSDADIRPDLPEARSLRLQSSSMACAAEPVWESLRRTGF